MLQEIRVKKGPLVSTKYVETIDETPKSDKKIKAQYAIEKEVYSALADSVADNAKLVSLVFAMGSAMYNALPDSTKNNIDASTKDKIEYAIKKYESIETWGDLQLKAEGTEAIDRLIDRQAKIGEIVKAIYNI